jgi:gluconate kinase
MEEQHAMAMAVQAQSQALEMTALHPHPSVAKSASPLAVSGQERVPWLGWPS